MSNFEELLYNTECIEQKEKEKKLINQKIRLLYAEIRELDRDIISLIESNKELIKDILIVNPNTK